MYSRAVSQLQKTPITLQWRPSATGRCEWVSDSCTALNPTGTCSRGRRKYHVDMFFSKGFGPLTTSKNSCRHDQNFHGITRGKPRFRSKKVQIRGYENCSCQASCPCFVFFSQFLGVWRFCLYLWVPYDLGHAFLTLFTVAALLFWCFLSRLVLEANERRKVLDGGFLGGFFTFQGCTNIYGFVITWGKP